MKKVMIGKVAYYRVKGHGIMNRAEMLSLHALVGLKPQDVECFFREV